MPLGAAIAHLEVTDGIHASDFGKKAPLNPFEPGKPVLNVTSVTDPFFSRTNTWLGNPQAEGHCGAALKGNAQASILLVPNAPHTLLSLPAARSATAGFLSFYAKAKP